MAGIGMAVAVFTSPINYNEESNPFVQFSSAPMGEQGAASLLKRNPQYDIYGIYWQVKMPPSCIAALGTGPI